MMLIFDSILYANQRSIAVVFQALRIDFWRDVMDFRMKYAPVSGGPGPKPSKCGKRRVEMQA